ncbi:magnesium chelatase subunit D [Aquincola tertiaricarbonis]|uniref:Magnesium chelatase subunit D n=1 Tax=Aquincola tertiaricarbonis TaxID=391953 RepID=A0ABY4S8B1_AQUTE|nr:magnesium chelatase subunit D [Aquincola tertiaricarbonis]URI07535.1 magnesium chelatase subunit D [Aquincola tertiaricarbonis]
MNTSAGPGADTQAADARSAAALLAVDPAGLGGLRLRAPAGPARDAWLALLQQLLPPATPVRRMPAHIGDERLLGGLDLGATLQARRPVHQPGLLQEARGGVLLLAMAERLPAATAGRIAAVLDAGEGAAMAVVALDEGEADEAPPAALTERLALHLDAQALSRGRSADGCMPAATQDLQAFNPARVAAARAALHSLPFDEDIATGLCAAAVALGITSARVPWLAWRAARAAAAWAGHAQVEAEDAELAARLVLGPRARQLPAGEAEDTAAEPMPAATAPPTPSAAHDDPPPAPQAAEPATRPDSAAPPPGDVADPATANQDPQALPDRLTAAAVSALPPGLLVGLAARAGQRHAVAASGRAGATQQHRRQGRPIGSVPGDPRAGRLDLIETLRAAAPWQPLRRREALLHGGPVGAQVLVRREDFRIRRFQQRRETTTVFAVDASGSLALHRLAEAKGAVELLLADCYVRRDKVALIAFRGSGAQLLLPPTRSLVRAKRCLAELPGGGGTPLSAGLDAARQLAAGLQRQGGSVLVVLMTDARANVGRGGAPGRERAAADALASARALRAAGLTSLMIDTGRDPQPAARALADAMGARYLPLPQADAGRLWQALRPCKDIAVL